MNGATKLKIYKYIDIGNYLCACQNFYAWGPPGSAGPPNVNLGPPNIAKSTRARMLKLDIVKYWLWVKNFSSRGRPGGVGPPSVNLGPP